MSGRESLPHPKYPWKLLSLASSLFVHPDLVSGKGFVAIVCSSTELPGYWIGAGAAVTGKDVQHAPKNLKTI
jgi:hypothetical protein